MRDMTVNVGILGIGKMGILHTSILNSLEGVQIKADGLISHYMRNRNSSITGRMSHS